MEPTAPSQPNNQASSSSGPDPSAPLAESSVSQPQASLSSNAETQPSAASQVSSSVTVEPTSVAGPVVDGVQSTGPTISSPSGGAKRKWLVPTVASGALVALLAGGYVFGMYLPNKPEAVFSKSLSQSGLALDKLIKYTQEQQKNPAKSASMDGTMNVKSSGASFDITMKGKSSNTDADITMDANVMGQKLTANLRMLDAESSDNPDLFFKVEGAKDMIEGFGGDAAQIAPYENKWIAVDHTVLDSLTSEAAGTSLSTTPTAEQLNDAMAKMQKVNREYIFTDNATKSVVQYKSFEGKTTKDGRDVNHYKATYNKENLKGYVKDLTKALDESKLNDWYKEQSGQSFSKSMQLKDLESAIDDAKEGYTFDMYVDTKTKLVQSLVFTNPDNAKDSYTIYQKYSGGSSYPMGLKFSGNQDGQKTSFDILVTTETKTNVITMDIDAEMGYEGSDATKIAGKFSITPSNDEVKVEKPSGALPFTTVMNQLGAGDGVLGAFTGTPSQL